jgi:hypothetical protein
MTAPEQGSQLRCGECDVTFPLDELMVVAAAEIAVFVAAHQHAAMSISLELAIVDFS